MAYFVSNVAVKNKVALNTASRIKGYMDVTFILSKLFYSFLLTDELFLLASLVMGKLWIVFIIVFLIVLGKREILPVTFFKLTGNSEEV